MLKMHLQPILDFFFVMSTERKERRSPQNSMLKNQQFVQQTHLQPIINYFNEPAQEKATNRKQSQRLQQPSSQQPSSQQPSSQSSDWLRWLWQTVIKIDTDPQVKQHVDHSGQVYWRVFDPVTDRRATFLSEDEVYQWLETRYYQ
jgi:hypothetical protein